MLVPRRFAFRLNPSLSLFFVAAFIVASHAWAQETPPTVINISTGYSSLKGAESNTTVNVLEGGEVGSQASRSYVGASDGSINNVVVNVDGGIVNGPFQAYSGSTINVISGSMATFFSAYPGSNVTIRGGSVGRFFYADPGSNVEIIGGEFRLNGAPYDNPEIIVGSRDVFTGTYSDGTPFVFGGSVPDGDGGYYDGDILIGVKLSLAALPSRKPSPAVVDGTTTDAPVGLRPDQDLTLREGGELGEWFNVIDATLRIDGGVVGPRLEAAGSNIYINGGKLGDHAFVYAGSSVVLNDGEIGMDFRAYPDSRVEVRGGSVGRGFNANNGSTVVIDGGTVGPHFRARWGSTVNINGGAVGSYFNALAGSSVTVRGGVIEEHFMARANSMLSVVGTEFFLDGALVDIPLGSSVVIQDRESLLSGVLADGTPFNLDLSSAGDTRRDLIAADAILTLTLVPEPSSIALLGLLISVGTLVPSNARRPWCTA